MADSPSGRPRAERLQPCTSPGGAFQDSVTRIVRGWLTSATRARSAPVLRTLARCIVPSGAVAMQSLKVPPVSMQMRQGLGLFGGKEKSLAEALRGRIERNLAVFGEGLALRFFRDPEQHQHHSD